ncbi:MAG: efflux RND transporter permease subunit, partial [Bdellovibrionales bacterium]|nr:efflux RND transporter permease subunit [Bdellovibrionales bacterium]
PVALFSTLLVSYLFGLSLNLISLIGLIIVLGMLVDDAIVVSENIWRHFEGGDDMMTSVINGASEVFSPVLASVLTTVSAFGPMLFMTGIFGAFVFEIPLMVILALSFSLFEAFIVMPSHFVSLIRPNSSHRQKMKEQSEKHWFNAFSTKYENFVSFSLKYRYRFFTGIFILLITTSVIMGVMGRFVLFPKEGTELFFIQIEAPKGSSLEKTMTLIKPIEKTVSELPKEELKDFVASVGIIQQDQTDPQTRRGSHYAQIRVALTAQNQRDRTAAEIIENLRKKIGKPEDIDSISFEEARQGPPQGRPISLNILGPDFEVLKNIGDQITDELSKIDGVVDVRSSFLPGKEEWQVIPDEKASATAGLTAQQISQSVSAAFDGIVASSIRELDEEVDIRVQLNKSEGSVLDQLNALKIGNNLGNLISLKQVAEFKKIIARSAITHLEFERLHNISSGVDLAKTTPAAVVTQVTPKISEILKKHSGYQIKFGGEDEDTQESFFALFRAFGFAAFIIFALLVITFKNLLQPFLVLTSIPLGFMGVAYAMLLHNRPFSFMAMLGVIALAGVIVNNAIVFTDFVNSERKNGKSLDDSITSAAKTRLRPIVLTTLTTVCGLLPTAYGDTLYRVFGLGGGDPFIVPIALSLGWGMTFGSILTGIFFPSFVRILDDISYFFKRIFRIV